MVHKFEKIMFKSSLKMFNLKITTLETNTLTQNYVKSFEIEEQFDNSMNSYSDGSSAATDTFQDATIFLSSRGPAVVPLTSSLLSRGALESTSFTNSYTESDFVKVGYCHNLQILQ